MRCGHVAKYFATSAATCMLTLLLQGCIKGGFFSEDESTTTIAPMTPTIATTPVTSSSFLPQTTNISTSSTANSTHPTTAPTPAPLAIRRAEEVDDLDHVDIDTREGCAKQHRGQFCIPCNLFDPARKCQRDSPVVASMIFVPWHLCGVDGHCDNYFRSITVFRKFYRFPPQKCYTFNDGRFISDASSAGYCISEPMKEWAEHLIRVIPKNRLDFEAGFRYSLEQRKTYDDPRALPLPSCSSGSFCNGLGTASGVLADCKCACSAESLNTKADTAAPCTSSTCPSGSCTLNRGQSCQGSDISDLKVDNAQACCDECTRTSGCTTFVFIEGGRYSKSCFLKRPGCSKSTHCPGGRRGRPRDRPVCTYGTMGIPAAQCTDPGYCSGHGIATFQPLLDRGDSLEDVGSCSCTCDRDFTGIHCQNRKFYLPDRCATIPEPSCTDSGYCSGQGVATSVSKNNGQAACSCACNDGYSGDRCEFHGE